MRCELSNAELYGGPPNHYRLRLNRRWLDAQDGKHLYFNEIGVAFWVARNVFGVLPCPVPKIKDKQRVKVKTCDNKYELTWTDTPPIQACDGRWYVAVLLFGKGKIFVPCDDVVTV